MSIVGGLDIHRKQLTFDYLDTVSGQVVARAGRARGPGAPARLAGPVRRARRRCRVRDRGLHRVAVRRRGAGRGRDRRAPGRAGRHRVRPRPQAARQDRQDRLPAPAAAAGRGPAARVLDPARAGPGVPGAAGGLPRPAPRAHRLGAADPRGLLPPGRPGPRREHPARRRRAGRGAGGRRRAPVAGRAAAGRHRPGHDRPAWRTSCTRCGTSCWTPPGTCRAPESWPSGSTGSGRSPRWR